MVTASLPILYPIWGLRSAPAADCVRQIARAGFDGVSFLAAPVDDPRRLDTMSAAEAQHLRRSLMRLGLERTLHVSSDHHFAGETSRSEQAVRRAQRSIEGCVRALSEPDLPPLIVSLDTICLPPGPTGVLHGLPPGPTGVLDEPLMVEMLGFLLDLSGRFPIRPALENWPKPGVGTPEALRGILAQTGGVGILLDLGHVNLALATDWCSCGSADEFIRALPAPVLEVHLHDNHGETDEHLPPGEGDADLVGAMGALVRLGFRGPLTVETGLRPNGRPGLAELCQGTRDIAERVLGAG